VEKNTRELEIKAVNIRTKIEENCVNLIEGRRLKAAGKERCISIYMWLNIN
jgi:hypothetical protein